MHTETRQLKDLISVGPAMLEDFELLGVRTVAQLRTRSPERMYRRLCALKKQRVDPCCLDVFVAAVAQARNPDLPIEQCQWWFWSRARKGNVKAHEYRSNSVALIRNQISRLAASQCPPSTTNTAPLM